MVTCDLCGWSISGYRKYSMIRRSVDEMCGAGISTFQKGDIVRSVRVKSRAFNGGPRGRGYSRSSVFVQTLHLPAPRPHIDKHSEILVVVLRPITCMHPQTFLVRLHHLFRCPR